MRDLSKVYETRRVPVEAVRGVSFTVERGEFVSLVGPSGCGKSTLLMIVAGLVDYERNPGEVSVAGSEARSGRDDVGIMLQKPVLLPWRTVLDNVLLPTEIFREDQGRARERAMELIERVGLSGFEDKHPWELSGGMQQRASLARVLVFEPDILLMDEPFAAVDEFTRERLNLQLTSLHETLHRTVLYVTHNLQEAVFLSDRVVVLKPRPGEVIDVIDVDLARPRRIEQLDDPRTGQLVARARRKLFDSGMEMAGDG